MTYLGKKCVILNNDIEESQGGDQILSGVWSHHFPLKIASITVKGKVYRKQIFMKLTSVHESHLWSCIECFGAHKL